MGERLAEFKGKVKEALGAFTGDRREEAEGRVEQRAAEEHGKVTDASLRQEEDLVRKAHGDM
jgi:uncharacterized protein YjbJ (UPF0337 family)